MKVIRWLLSHTFLILLIVVVIYGYMFWGNLLGKETPAGKAVAYLSEEFVAVKDFVDAVKEKQARLNNAGSPESDQQVALQSGLIKNTDEIVQQEETIEIESSPSETIVIDKLTTRIEHKPTNATGSEKQQAMKHRAEMLAAKQAAVDNRFDREYGRQNVAGTTDSGLKNSAQKADASHTTDHKNMSSLDSRDVDAETSDVNVTNRAQVASGKAMETNGADSRTASNALTAETVRGSAAASPDSSSEKDTFVSAEIKNQLDNVDKQGKVIDDSQNSDTVRDDWITARKSFYQRNYKLSEQSYQKVIEKSDDNFDAYGELGNVYFNQGKNKEAASAYYEAAAILVRKGQVSRARSLMGLLRHLDDSKADGLKKLIDSQQS